MPFERVFDVFKAAQTVVADLGRSRTRTYQFSNRLEDGEARSELAGEELGLVEASGPQAVAVERHGHDASGAKSLDDEALRDELGEGRGEAAPAFVLEAVDGCFGRAFVSDRRSEPAQRTKSTTAAAVATRALELDAASPAKGLLEAMDPGPTAVTEPGTDGTATATPRRQDEVEKVHESSVWAVSRTS